MFYVDSEKAMEDAIVITGSFSRNSKDSEFDICFPNKEMCHLFMKQSVRELRKNKDTARSNLKVNIHIRKMNNAR
jgi:hypothetical protein